MNIDLFYLSPNPYGGWVTYTTHLMRALRAVGLKPTLYKIRPRAEKKKRAFGYGEKYQNIRLADAEASNNPKLIVAAAKNFREQTAALLGMGAKLIVHDPTELKNLPSELDQKRCAVIRKVGLEFLPDATFIRHPYERRPLPKEARYVETRAVSTSRIDFDKHTEIILDANLILPERHRVQIYGFENRLYTRFKIVPKYPHWQQSVMAYPRNADAAFNILRTALFSVDMSIIKGDGGGTQYTTLEAWDAGAVPIIHEDWIREGDDMVPGFNCLTVGSGEELALKLTNPQKDEWEQLCVNGAGRLGSHEPTLIGLKYKKFLEGN